jgi:YD repeat-containing protein
MVQSVGALGATDYKLNSVGQRIRKANTQGDTVYHYDSQGRLIAESSAAGATQKEYIYLGDIPVGVSVAPADAYFVHTDQLNTPRVITNSVGQAVWTWGER